MIGEVLIARSLHSRINLIFDLRSVRHAGSRQVAKENSISEDLVKGEFIVKGKVLHLGNHNSVF